MDIYNIKNFSKELIYILTLTLDGAFTTAWSFFYFFNGLQTIITEKNTSLGFFRTTIPIILLLVLIRMRINHDYKIRLNLGALISINAMSIILLKS